MKVVQHHIGGRLMQDRPERTGDVFDPATGATTKQVALAGPDVVDRAVAAAAGAFEEWSKASLARRTRVLFAFRELVERHRDHLAHIIMSEHGKVLTDAEGEIGRGQEVVEFACGIPQLLKGGYSENVSSSVDSFSVRQPVGVVACITPFNFPVMVPMWMYPIAIACGNAVVLKPSEKVPSASNVVADLWREAGLPEGVFNVVHGDKVAVDRLLQHPDVAAVSSVGSTPVARYIYKTAAGTGKRVQALGGAKNHMIVLPDADVTLAADAAVSAGFGSSGQRCMAVSTVVAVGEAAGPLRRALVDRIEALRVGPGDDRKAEMGPLVTAAHRERVASYLEAGVSEGAELAVDGRDLKVDGFESGFFLGPCLFDRVRPEMSVYTDEIFGPVLIMLRVESYDHAISLVNANPFGNGTAVFTNDGGAARKFVHEIEVGMVGINVPIPVPMAFYSFGGWKDSLFGDTHVYGEDGVRFYTRSKVVTSRWPDPELRGVRLGFPSSS